MKILIIKDALSYGGVDQLTFNLLDNIDFSKHTVDIQYFNEGPTDAIEKYKKYNCRLIGVPRTKKGILRFIRNEYRILKSGHYDVVHSHICFKGAFSAIAAWLAKVPVMICHSHYEDYPEIRRVSFAFKALFKVLPCTLAACSNGAGTALYGKNSSFVFLKNGIDTDRFSYKPQLREEVRKELGLEGKFVIGNVSRMITQKNHTFILDVFKEVLAKNENAFLLLVGDGELRGEIEKKVRDMKLEDHVRLLGVRSDVDRLLQAMDVFLFPTLFEGLSMSLLEVQCSGLACVSSDVVPKEAKITECIEFVPLSCDSEYWAKRVLDITQNYQRRDMSDVIKANGFGKKESAMQTIKFYESQYNNYVRRFKH